MIEMPPYLFSDYPLTRVPAAPLTPALFCFSYAEALLTDDPLKLDTDHTN